jgi:RNA polymerase sigma-70 factor (ECF subfamily)
VTTERREQLSDEVLVRQARDGDVAALSALVERHQGAVYRMALSMVSDPDAAQDIAQDAFVKAIRGLRSFRGEAAFRTWLLTITANTARGSIRKRGRRRETALESAPEPAAGEPGADESVVVTEEAERARRMMSRLPEKQRLSVQLRIDEGMSFREIGEAIGSSEGAARVNYFHGIRKLRELME